MKKMFRFLCVVVVCLLMALPVNSTGYQTSLFVSPVPSLSWCMCREDVIEQLGLSQEVVDRGRKTDLWLTPEELGWNPADFLGLDLHPNGSRKGGDIRLIFQDKRYLTNDIGAGAWRSIEFYVSAPDEQYLLNRLERLYGQSILPYDFEGNFFAVWNCYQITDRTTVEEMEYLGLEKAIPRNYIYPTLVIREENRKSGDEMVFRVAFSAGEINYPKGYSPIFDPDL